MLFVGGEKDGQWIRISEYCSRTGRVEFVSQKGLEPVGSDVRACHEVISYSIMQVIDVDGSVHKIAVLSGTKNPLALLIKGYKRNDSQP